MWATGRWLGDPALGAAVTAAVTAVTTWADGADAEVVIDASALAGPAAEPPALARRTVHIVSDGRRDPELAARQGAVVAAARARALAGAPQGRTANVIVVPDGFPGSETAPSAPVSATVGLADLVHALEFLLDPANGYVTGQVIALLGGDDVWGL